MNRCVHLKSGYASHCKISDLKIEELPFNSADAPEPIVHRFWVSENGRGRMFGASQDGQVSLSEFMLVACKESVYDKAQNRGPAEERLPRK